MRKIALAIVLMLLWTSAFAADYPCSTTAQFKSALASAQAGDTITLADGTYQDTAATWTYAFNPAHSGSAGGGYITIRSENPLGAVIDGYNDSVVAIGPNSRSYIAYDGLRITGAFQAHTCDHITVQNCEVTGGFDQDGDHSLRWGIAFEYVDNGLIRNNYVHDMDQYFEAVPNHNSACIMLYGDCDNNIIEYNTVNGDTTSGSSSYWIGDSYGTKAGGMDDNIWRYNFGMNTSVCGFVSMGATAGGGQNYRNKVHNNVIINTTSFFQSYKSGVDWEVFNNSAYNCTYMFDLNDVYGSDQPIDHTFYNNLGSGLTTGYYRGTNTPAWTSGFFTYCDYNQLGGLTYWGYGAQGQTQTSLSDWQSAASVDAHSTATSPGFVNPGGTTPADYKRTSYPTAGRGGAYSSVIGAYEDGAEIIGYSADSSGTPASPTLSNVTISGGSFR